MPKLRRGRKLSRTDGLQTLYIQEGDEPADEDRCIGLVLTPEMAEVIVQAVNSDEKFRRMLRLE